MLTDVNLSKKQGEIAAVIDRNGMGKTTLMLGLIGMVSATDETVLFDGVNLTQSSADMGARIGIGYVPQGRDFFLRLVLMKTS